MNTSSCVMIRSTHVAAAVFLVVVTVCQMTSAYGQDKKEEKRFSVEFDKTPWGKVFEWYVDQTGLPYASKWPAPAGTFSHSTPKGRTYTLHETTVIINDSLMKEGYVLVPRPQSTTLVKIAKE